MVRFVRIIATSAAVMCGGLLAQTPPVSYLSSSCIKVLPGKMQEYRKFVADYSLKANTHLVNSGKISSYSLLRAVIPQGEEARCDYLAVTVQTGAPAAPFASGEQDKLLQAAGVNISWSDFVAKRTTLTKLVATELWRTQERVGAIAKGDYLYLNRMRVHNPQEYVKFEREVWKPLAEAMISDGRLKAWTFSTIVLPAGTDVRTSAVTADVFGSWDAVFRPGSMADTWKKVHPNRNIEETMASVNKLREIAKRELFVVEERVASAPTAISQTK